MQNVKRRKPQSRKRTARLLGGSNLALERRLAYRFALLSGRMIRAAANIYTPRFGLRPSAWKTMAAIGRYGPISAKELTAYTTVPPDKITRAVDQLVAFRWASRRKDASDRRRVVLSLNDRGMKVFEEIETLIREMEQQVRSGLTAKERLELDRLLTKLEQRASEFL